jgi:O-antigen ligase
MRPRRGIALAVRVRDEWTLLRGLLESVRGHCDEAWVLDDASAREAPRELWTALPRLTVLRASAWSGGPTCEGLQRDYLLQRMKRECSCEWILQLDADERLNNIAALASLVTAKDCDAWVLPLVDYYITPEDEARSAQDAPDRVRNWFGVETRWTLCLYRPLDDLYIAHGVVREPQGFRSSRVQRTGSLLVEHYGKAISETEWERKVNLYISTYADQRTKWLDRKGKAVHHYVSDFGTPLLHRNDRSFMPSDAPCLHSYAPRNGIRHFAKTVLFGRLAQSLRHVFVLPPSRTLLPYASGTILAIGIGGSVAWRPAAGFGFCLLMLSVGALVIPSGRPVITAFVVALVVGSAGSHLLPTVAGVEVTSWIFLLLAATGLMARSIGARKWRSRLSVAELGSLVLVVAGLAAALGAANTSGSVAGALTMGQHVCILIAIVSMPARMRNVRWVLAGLLVGVLFQVVVGLVELGMGQTIYYSLWKPLEAATWRGFLRVASTPADPNYFALGLVSTIPLVIAARTFWPRVPRFAVYAGVSLWLVMIASTFSRAGYAGLLAAGALGILFTRGHRRWVIAGTVLLAAAAAWFLFPEAIAPFTGRFASIGANGDASILMRAAAQRAAAQAFVDHPLFGIGLGQFVSQLGPQYLYAVSGLVVSEINVLNSYLLIACETGIIGLGGFLVAVGWTLRKLRRTAGMLRDAAALEDRMLGTLARHLWASLIVWSLVSLTLDSVHSPIQWALLGLGALIYRCARSRMANTPDLARHV